MPNLATDPLSVTFAALADPTRRAMLARLAMGEASVSELAEPFDLSQPAISKHLKVLEKAGLVSRSKTGQLRPRRLDLTRLKEIDDWVAHYRRFWEQSFDHLDDYLMELQGKQLPDEQAPGQQVRGKRVASKQSPGKQPKKKGVKKDVGKK
ncbi:MAG TPA: metalloregulator ArsR/SmtB family transcription factor [Terriglobales bacterium]|nr:metalloregulator ArsR/SmtB family transcription factor [Terriglobales bacterium]